MPSWEIQLLAAFALDRLACIEFVARQCEMSEREIEQLIKVAIASGECI